jgi:hypothetical protein
MIAAPFTCVPDTQGRPASIDFFSLRRPQRNHNVAGTGTNRDRTAHPNRSRTGPDVPCDIVMTSHSRNQVALTAAFSRAGARAIDSLLGSPAEEPRW